MNLIDLAKEIPDPRDHYKIKHNLSTIVFVTLCGVLCGAESWSDISLFCEAKYAWLSKHVDLSNGVPSAWTFRRIFTLLTPDKLEWLLKTHALNITKNKQVDHIAIDGKALCGSKRHDLRCLHSISALCHEHGVILAETGVDKKSNEITAIPMLLDMLNIKGSTITIDAAGCQKDIAIEITEKKGNYVLGLKKNHRKFYEAVETYTQNEIINAPHRLKDEFEKSHGRTVRRRYFACDSSKIKESSEWSGIKSVIAVETITSSDIEQKVTAQWRYYISSHQADNQLLADYIRNHWSIESAHWILDVHLKEDDDRKAEAKSAKAFGVLRRIALNIARQKQDSSKRKRSLRGKFKLAGWDNNYLLELLT